MEKNFFPLFGWEWEERNKIEGVEQYVCRGGDSNNRKNETKTIEILICENEFNFLSKTLFDSTTFYSYRKTYNKAQAFIF